MDETNRQGVIVLISLGFAPPPAPPPKPCSLFRGPKDAASRRHGVSPAPRRTPFPVPWPAWPVWPGPPAEATWRPRTGHRAVETYGKGAGTEGAGALYVAPPLPSAATQPPSPTAGRGSPQRCPESPPAPLQPGVRAPDTDLGALRSPLPRPPPPAHRSTTDAAALGGPGPDAPRTWPRIVGQGATTSGTLPRPP